MTSACNDSPCKTARILTIIQRINGRNKIEHEMTGTTLNNDSGLTHDQELPIVVNGTTIAYLLISSVKVNNLVVDKTVIARILFAYDVFICSTLSFLLKMCLFPRI